MKKLIFTLLITSIFLTGCTDSGQPSSIVSESARKSAPLLSGPTLDGSNYTMASNKTTVVNVWASWCGPCRMAAPEVEALAKEMAGRALVVKVCTETHPEIAEKYRVQSIPQFNVFRRGQVHSQHNGFVPRWEMQRWLEQAEAAPGSP